MSEQKNDLPFGTPQEGDLDIASIFGTGTPGSEDNPFAAAASAPAPQPTPVPTQAPAAPVAQPATETVPAEQPVPQPAPAPTQEPAKETPVSNPLEAAIASKEAEHAQSLFEKAPMFAYGSAKDPINDASKTFEELRIEKSEDFPELGEGKRVSWTVEYGKVSKPITDPKGKTIQSVKEEIERSKEFLEGLKKAKDKNPDCLVKPRVTAQSKGIAAYKGVFTTVEEARASGKTICLIPAEDGRVYEMRKTDLGEFIAPKNNVVDFQAVRAGFTPALPLIPQTLLQQIISFFRCYMEEDREFEALAHILWDRELEEFTVHIPAQTVTKAHIIADLTGDAYPEDRYIHYADIHSHNSMEAKFSPIDDGDEKATRLYIVVGRLDKFFPDVTVRMSCGGAYLELDPGLIFESVGEVFPQEWRKNVRPAQHVRIPAGARRLVAHFASDKEFFAPGEDE